MSLRYIIDGYNLIHHPLFSSIYKNTGTPAQALLLCIRTYHLTGSPRNELVVVFDGYPPGDYRQEYASRVVFSGDESADEYIKRLIHKAAHTRTLVVVSDDKEIALSARAHQARACSGNEFFKALQDARLARQKLQKQEDNGKLGYSQMQEINKELRQKWLK